MNEITTQDLFDGILTHVRVQGGPGECKSYNSEDRDGYRCVKGIWMADSIGNVSESESFNFIEKCIEYRIGRSLTSNERDIFDILEAAYETYMDFLLATGYLTRRDRKLIKQANKISEVRKRVRYTPDARFMPPLFEPVAERVAKKFNLKYAPPNELPLMSPLKVKDCNPHLYSECKKLALLLAKEQSS